MTQELDKEALEDAVIEYWRDESRTLRGIIADAIRAYLNHPNVAKDAERIKALENALEALRYVHDGNPSDALADMEPVDYARHILGEVRKIARDALIGGDA